MISRIKIETSKLQNSKSGILESNWDAITGQTGRTGTVGTQPWSILRSFFPTLIEVRGQFMKLNVSSIKI